ncbi:MAG: electron transfer flavoprotein subunit alpha/FixB family protein [Oscillospiraceae bacterium]|nr:electron transfer flavoprotein subunit alpha/FixB family protein [Oscillospiraceae bacterium]
MKELWIVAEQNRGVIAASFYEILSKAKAVYASAQEQPCFAAVVLAGDEMPAAELKSSGVDKIYLASEPMLADYNPALYTAVLTAMAETYRPEILLVAASAQGSEVAPGVSARLKTGLAAHCTELKLDEQEQLHMIAPAFGGKLMGEYIIPTCRPVMASIKPGVFESVPQTAKDAELVCFDASDIVAAEAGIELVSSEEVVETELPIEKAEVLVCAGLGSAVTGNFEKVKTFAKKLGASFCYTRPIADLGYMPNEHAMVGTSGKTVKPKLYIGFGVSGAAQHVCGMKDSGMIININSDEEADSFRISNYKVVSDCGAVLDELLKQI